MTATTPALAGRTDAERGFSLVETMVALCLLLVVTAGVLPLAVLTFRISENHGHLLARATEYSQDKLEQLMALSYGDVVTDTRVFPAVTTGGTGLTPGGQRQHGSAGGRICGLPDPGGRACWQWWSAAARRLTGITSVCGRSRSSEPPTLRDVR